MMGGDELRTFMDVLMAMAGGVIAIGGAVAVFEHIAEKGSIRRNKVAEQVAKHSDTLEKHAQYLDNDDKRLESMEQSNKLIMRGVMQLMSHEIDGNHTAQLKKTRDDMENYLIEK